MRREVPRASRPFDAEASEPRVREPPPSCVRNLSESDWRLLSLVLMEEATASEGRREPSMRAFHAKLDRLSQARGAPPAEAFPPPPDLEAAISSARVARSPGDGTDAPPCTAISRRGGVLSEADGRVPRAFARRAAREPRGRAGGGGGQPARGRPRASVPGGGTRIRARARRARGRARRARRMGEPGGRRLRGGRVRARVRRGLRRRTLRARLRARAGVDTYRREGHGEYDDAFSGVAETATKKNRELETKRRDVETETELPNASSETLLLADARWDDAEAAAERADAAARRRDDLETDTSDIRL